MYIWWGQPNRWGGEAQINQTGRPARVNQQKETDPCIISSTSNLIYQRDWTFNMVWQDGQLARKVPLTAGASTNRPELAVLHQLSRRNPRITRISPFFYRRKMYLTINICTFKTIYSWISRLYFWTYSSRFQVRIFVKDRNTSRNVCCYESASICKLEEHKFLRTTPMMIAQRQNCQYSLYLSTENRSCISPWSCVNQELPVTGRAEESL